MSQEFKYSEEFLLETISFLNKAKSEIGELGYEKTMQMLDVFDPQLPKDVMMFALYYGKVGNVLISVPLLQKNKISAIKAIRKALGLGLKEAKDLCDEAVNPRGVRIRNASIQQLNELQKELEGTGYSLKN